MEDKQRILIVDDERFNINVLVNILKSEYKTIVAKTGEEALRRVASENPPDLILLDIMMPEMDGYEVCRRLKADKGTRDIPVVFVTAMGDTEDETRGLNLGAIDYITKPVSPPIVRARVRNHLELKRSREEVEEQRQQLEAQNQELLEAAELREDVERITRHDLKTPLNAIIGFTEVLMIYDNFTDEQSAYLTMIRESGYQMLDMINLSLDLFKMERGVYQFEPASVGVLEVIRKIIKDTENIAKRRNVSLDILMDEKPAEAKDTFPVWGDKFLCYSMLANLIKNALEAAPEGHEITISLKNEEDEAAILIHNPGKVPEDIRDRFFDKYVTSGKNKGAGLGTYSAKLMAEAQNGDISMYTDEGGTTLTIRMPR